MGEKNSSLTRVQPVFNALLDRWPTGQPWLSQLCDMAAAKRPSASVPLAAEVALSAVPPLDGRMGTIFERAVAPPAAFLRWLLDHPERMNVTDRNTFGATDPDAQAWRRKLFAADPTLVGEAQREARAQLATHGVAGSRHRWWAFEGFTHVDCCLVMARAVIFVEGKRTESLSPTTRWFAARSQLWRNVEAAQQLAGGKSFGVILAVENEADGRAAVAGAEATLAASNPQLTEGNRAEMARHFLGVVTWRSIVERFGLPPECLPNTVTSHAEGRDS